MKKTLLVSVICLALASVAAHAGPGMHGQGAQGQGLAPIGGKVIETVNSGGYTYVQVENEGNKFWIAVPTMKVKKGEVMFFEPGGVMVNFESKTLGRKFDEIMFSGGAVGLPKELKTTKSAPASAAKDVKVAKAEGKDAYTVEELYKKAASLDKKTATVRGSVTKFSSGIMGKNWVHIQDGTGSQGKGTHDLTVTTDGEAKVGDVVTATGTIAKDKDFGAGYKFDVIMEDAALSK